MLSHSICLHACKICVVFVETKPESNSRKLRKVLSPPHNTGCTNWADFKKVHLSLRKLGTVEHTKFANHILPPNNSDLTFTEAVQLLTELFSPQLSPFHKKWKCMNLTRKDDKVYTTIAVNKHCDDFKLSELSANNFKCLIFVQGLVSNKDAEIRRRVLDKLERTLFNAATNRRRLPKFC